MTTVIINTTVYSVSFCINATTLLNDSMTLSCNWLATNAQLGFHNKLTRGLHHERTMPIITICR